MASWHGVTDVLKEQELRFELGKAFEFYEDIFAHCGITGKLTVSAVQLRSLSHSPYSPVARSNVSASHAF